MRSQLLACFSLLENESDNHSFCVQSRLLQNLIALMITKNVILIQDTGKYDNLVFHFNDMIDKNDTYNYFCYVFSAF